MIDKNEIPQSWEVVKLGDVCIYSKGKMPKALNKEKNKDCFIPYINIKAFEKGIFAEYTNGEKCNLCEEGDLLMVWDGARCGMVGKAKKGAVGSTLMKIIPIESVCKEFLFYFINSKFSILNTNPKGVGIPHIEPTLLWNMNFPLPPLSEQYRIVSKIEELFTELDKGIETLKTTQQQLKVYRQAVLKWAFEGRLNYDLSDSCDEHDGKPDNQKNHIHHKNHSSDNGLPDGWEWKTIEDVANISTGVTPLRTNKSYWEKGTIPWITSGALNEEFVTKADEFVTKKAFTETTLKLLPKHTLLLALYGEGKTRGKCSELMFASTTNQAIAGIILKKEFEESRKFIKWFLFKNYQDIRLLSSGGVQPNLNSTIVKKTKLPFPPAKEQTKIVSAIESRLSVCDKVEETIENTLQQAEALRLSILKKAFEGKLVKQNPKDEPAAKLLEKIRKMKDENGKTKNPRKLNKIKPN